MSSESPTQIKVGFVGLSTSGWAASALAPSLIQPTLRNTYDIVAVSTTSEATAQASAIKYSEDVGHPIKAYFGDASKIASDSDVDLVAVAVKAPHHRQIVLSAIEAKKDFFVEWPAGASLKDTKDIAAAAHEQGIRSIVGLQGRHSAVIRKVLKFLSSGAIGPIRSTIVIANIPREAHLWAPFSEEKYLYSTQKKNGAALLDIPIGHQLDTLTYLLGDFVDATAREATFYPTGTVVDAEGNPTGKTYPVEFPDHYVFNGILKSGVLANVFWRSGYASNKARPQLTWDIEGDEGSIRMQLKESFGPSIVKPDLYLNGEKVELEVPGTVIDSLGIVWKDFAELTSGYATIDDAVRNRRLLQAIETSAKTGKRIDL